MFTDLIREQCTIDKPDEFSELAQFQWRFAPHTDGEHRLRVRYRDSEVALLEPADGAGSEPYFVFTAYMFPVLPHPSTSVEARGDGLERGRVGTAPVRFLVVQRDRDRDRVPDMPLELRLLQVEVSDASGGTVPVDYEEQRDHSTIEVLYFPASAGEPFYL